MESFSNFFDTICRVCGKSCSEHTVSLFEDESGKLSCFGKAISTFANVVISIKDNLPRKICPNCLYQLRQAILFKIKCERNHRIFKFLVSNHNGDLNQEAIEKAIAEYVMFKEHFPSSISMEHPSTPPPKRRVKTKLKKTPSRKKMKREENVTMDITEPDISYLSDNNTACDNENTTFKPKALKRTVKEKSTKILRRKQKKAVANKKYECEICHKILANKQTYTSHKWRHTGGRYMCEHCGKGYPTNSELETHKVHSHGTGRFLQCPSCSYKAASRFTLMEHERLHSGERPFACDKCGLTFRRRFIWSKHLLLHAEKTVQCTLCPRRFHRKGDLVAHCNNVHERRYLFACQYCGTSYAKSATMRKHYTERHNVKREEQGRLVKVRVGANNGGQTILRSTEE